MVTLNAQVATQRYIAPEIATFELRVSVAQAVGLADSEAQHRLTELRAAYTSNAD